MKEFAGFALSLIAFCVSAHAQSPAASNPAAPGPATPAGPARPTLPSLLDRAASRLEAGGVIAAEAGPDGVRTFSAGHPAPRADIPPEKVIFEIGSITKVFTSLLLAQAVVEHKVSLDDPISRYLPPSLAMDPATAAITLEQLATHTSGLPRMPDNFSPKDRLDPFADYGVENLYAYLRAYRPKAPPPHPGDYSNLGVGLLGHILELVYQKPYADLIAAKITQPLGLPDTVVNLNAEQQGRFAVPHSGSRAVKPWHLSALAGAGALHSTAADLVHFAQILMTPQQNPLREAWEIARQPRHDFSGDKIGLNVMIHRRNGETVYWHGGGTGGFRSYLEWSAQSGRHVLVILLNNDAIEGEALASALYEAKPDNPAERAGRVEAPLPAGKAAEYIGVYELNPMARFTLITDASGRLQARLTGQPFFPLFNAGNDRFFLRIVQAELQFGRSPEGRVTSVTLFQNGREIRAQRTDDPVPTVLFLPPAKEKEYVGRYELQPGYEFQISIKAGWLLVKLTGQPAFPIFSDQPDHFVLDVVKAAITFERSPDGAVKALVLHQNDRDQRAEKQLEGK